MATATRHETLVAARARWACPDLGVNRRRGSGTMNARSTGVDIEDVQDGGDHTLRLRGELDMAGVPSVEALVNRICAAGPTSVTLDLSDLSFIDSTGLAAIVHVSGLCDKHGHRFQIVPGPPSVQRLFEVTGLDGVLPFADGGRGAPAGDGG
jgi:anti-anti-sigma factor